MIVRISGDLICNFRHMTSDITVIIIYDIHKSYIFPYIFVSVFGIEKVQPY